MIVAENNKPTIDEFVKLMKNTDNRLNDFIKCDENIKTLEWNAIEKIVLQKLEESAKGTAFDNTIKLVSGHKFPDIVASRYYGVEVKSTKGNHWITTGGSILEGTRIENIERIFITFGKLGGDKIEFLSRPYEECLFDIAVTHSPRYKIDMQLEKGQTIFDKIGMPYDDFRKMQNPIEKISQYYSKDLKDGEKLWWATTNQIILNSPPILRFWNNLSKIERDDLLVKGFILFPEVVVGKYDNFSMWLVTANSIINTHIRDSFSAGGEVIIERIQFPQVYNKLIKHYKKIKQKLYEIDEQVLMEYWKINTLDNRLNQWFNKVIKQTNKLSEKQIEILRNFFEIS